MSAGSPGGTRERDPAPTSASTMSPAPSRGPLALAGALAGAAGVVVSQAVALVLGAEGPVSSVAAAVRDLTPGRLAIALIHLVGHLDKPLLIGGTAVVLLGICAVAGTFARRRPAVPDYTFLALAALGVAAVLRAPEPALGAVVAIGVGLASMMISFRVLSRPLLDAIGADPADGSRRAFLIRAGVVLLIAGAAAGAGRLLTSGRRHAEEARRALRLPVSRGSAPSGSTIGVSGIEPWRTPQDDFYIIHTAISPPSISPSEWKLRIHGMVENEITIDFEELLARPVTEAWVTLCCVSNEVGGDLIGNAHWSGVLVRELLEQAKPLAGADAVKQTSQDGWNCGTPLSILLDPDRNAMLAYAMNGEALPVDHGFPVRMVVPGLYGYVSATKWVVDLEVTRFADFSAYWTDRGWTEKGPVKTSSRVDVPANGATVKAGKVRIGGSAWAQHTGIAKVEFQLDGGAWQQAELGRVPAGPSGTDTWVQWVGTVDVAPGDHRLYVRASDTSGYVQTAAKADPYPSGATGWDTHPFSAS